MLKSRKWKILISIVSHGQTELVNELIRDLELQTFADFLIIVRENIKVSDTLSSTTLPHIYTQNIKTCGFAENHNKNYEIAQSQYFLILNPDIRITDKNFLEKYYKHVNENKYEISAPRISDKDGNTEESARSFPTILSLLKKFFTKRIQNIDSLKLNVDSQVNWLAGMFICFESHVYKNLKGLNEKYFLYYEDVDIGWRAQQRDYKSTYIPHLEVVHNARRSSHTNWHFKKLHLSSMFRFLITKILKKT